MTFDAIAYLMAKLDRALSANQDLWQKQHITQQKVDALENRVSSLERLSLRFSQLARLALPLLVLILAGLAILGPKQTAEIILAILKAAV